MDYVVCILFHNHQLFLHTNSSMTCPTGYTMRKSYKRTYKANVTNKGFVVRRKGKTFITHPTQHNVHVPAHCVKNPKPKGTIKIGKLRKGDLIKYGYQDRLPDKARHKALEKAIKAYGLSSVYHKLDAIAKLSVSVAPDASTVFARDREWIHIQMRK